MNLLVAKYAITVPTIASIRAAICIPFDAMAES